MIRLFRIIVPFLLLIISFLSCAQTTADLRKRIYDIISTKNAEVGVSICGRNGNDTVSVNGNGRFPMQSVFKYHIALAMLSEIQKGKFSLGQEIQIREEEMLPGIYSPIRERYPQGVILTISEILKFTVSQSDNVGCDLLLRLLGGPASVEAYFAEHGFKNVSIKINEEVMQSNWDLQFQNWTTPVEATEVLRSFYHNDKGLLTNDNHAFFWKALEETQTGRQRLRGFLPPGTVVAHKTGWSGTNSEGITAAVNDIGVILLPEGAPLFISVFVTNSREDYATNEMIIAEIAKAAWDHFSKKPKQESFRTQRK
jgi:beta-lactamase class A